MTWRQELGCWVLVALAAVWIVMMAASCSAIAPNTAKTLEELPAGAFEPLWLVVESLAIDAWDWISFVGDLIL